jgi:hypothetical protein
MECPACNHTLTPMNVSNITVDACRGGCGGVWFDRFEIDKVDEPHEEAGIELLDIERDPSKKVDYDAQRKCPKCDDANLMRHFYDVKREILVDECPACAGLWLDTGELTRLRSQYRTEEERNGAVDREFDKLLAASFSKMKADREAKLDTTRRIARMFRFICPSWYIPGKQDWGAF